MATTAEINAFIKRLGALAVFESNRRIANGGGFVLPSICIAQSALETGWGTSSLMTKANAFFGIKAGGSWTGKVYRADTWEVADGVSYNTTANFRAYDTLEESVRDYYDLIANNSRYSGALSFGTNASAWKTPNACITAIWAGGYATDTLYVEKIMSTVNARNLAAYDAKIDGVSMGEGVASNHTFTRADMVQGSLTIQDSGRTIGNDTTVTNAVALDWSKAFEVEYNSEFIVKFSPLPENTVIKLARLQGDTPSIDGAGLSDFFSMGTAKGQKIGFYIERTGAGVLSIDDIPKDFTIEFSNPINPSTGIDNSPRYDEPLALFVEIK